MKKSFLTTTFALSALALPLEASANIWIPSFVQMLTAPMAYFIYIIPLPLIFLIALIEALVLRQYVKGIPLWLITEKLAIINSITSLIGLVTLPTGTELWPGLLSAYVATVVLEFGLMLWRSSEINLKVPRSTILKISAQMNFASYSLLAITLICLVYLPALKYEDRSLLNRMSGRLSVFVFDDSKTLDMNLSPFALSQSQDMGAELQDYQVLNDASVVAIFNEAATKKLTWQNGWQAEPFKLPKPGGKLIAVSPDGKLMLAAVNGKEAVITSSGALKRVVSNQVEKHAHGSFSRDNRFLAYSNPLKVIDLKSGKIVNINSSGYSRFHPNKSVLAWGNHNSIIFFDCLSGKKKSLPIPGNLASFDIGWSPDGRFIAYLGNPNQYTAQMWNPDLRVTDTQSGRSVTVHSRLFTCGRPFAKIIWLR